MEPEKVPCDVEADRIRGGETPVRRSPVQPGGLSRPASPD